MNNQRINELKNRVLNNGEISLDEAISLILTPDTEQLYSAAEEITRACCPREFDSCSIINARSGLCSENCKWCAQSAHYSTGCETYDLVEEEECMEAARYNHARGVHRFSLVASGRAVRGRALDGVCSLLNRIGKEVGISTCASLGLLSPDELKRLWESGVRRYHCNLETAPSYFPHLCSTHTIDDKIATIKAAKAIGFEVCSGGIIGMGESPEQRVELAFKLREISPASIPLNVLCPIPGTPLADTPPLSDREILSTVAVFRFIHPRVQIRFAGGRARLSRDTQLRAMRIGVNGAIMGDLLTTIGSRIADDRNLVHDAGYDF